MTGLGLPKRVQGCGARHESEWLRDLRGLRALKPPSLGPWNKTMALWPDPVHLEGERSTLLYEPWRPSRY